ncbi:DEAD/DEAH box helicase [Hirschia litorea]|uniref:DEAD/DEAH box helicase n=1 Tax=Hirschia litorea TaxID=1199156 RepID=A0ABW2II34_9PROT
MTFDDLDLDPRLLSAVKDAGYTEPTPIQAQAIPAVIQGRDVTGIAQTGTGKTAAFVLPMIHKLGQGRAKARMPRTLILEPTRELAAQVAENFEKYGVNHKLNMALLIGGVSFADQDKKITAGADVLIATPGRLMDHFERGRLLMTGVQMLVIDEADRMLDMGFIPDIEKICKLLPTNRQTLLFSATMPPEIAKLTKQFQNDPKQIEVARPAQTAELITQYMTSSPSDKDEVKRGILRAIIGNCDVKNGIVFCNRKTEVDIVAKSLNKHGFDAAPIHGDLPQSYRMETLDKFRNGDLKLLVASDVAARGLDVPDVSHVFNYAPPPNSDDYVHRIGRTGRAGRTGESYTIVSPRDSKLWDAVLKRIGKDIEQFSSEAIVAAIADVSARPERKPNKKNENRNSKRKGRHGRTKDRAQSDEQIANNDAVEAPTIQKTEHQVEKPKQEKKKRSNKRGNDDLGPSFKGMGEHVPAFLLRPVDTTPTS